MYIVKFSVALLIVLFLTVSCSEAKEPAHSPVFKAGQTIVFKGNPQIVGFVMVASYGTQCSVPPPHHLMLDVVTRRGLNP